MFAAEFYKIVTRKLNRICFLVVFVWILLQFFMTGPFNERCSLGTNYGNQAREDFSGFAAIKKDRELAARYEGVLTDEKIRRMAEECFFQEKSGRIVTNANFVNKFFTGNGLTDEVPGNGEDYVPASKTIRLQDSSMGAYADRPILFAYIRGWQVLQSLMQIGSISVCLFLIIALAPVFAEEYSLKTAPVLMTTAHGRGRDIGARIGAAAVFSFGSFLFFGILMVLLCGCCYGFQGLSCFAGMLSYTWMLPERGVGSISYMTIGQYFGIYFLFLFLGVGILTAFMLFASAISRQIYTALLLGLVFFVLPVILWGYVKMAGTSMAAAQNLLKFIYSMPVFACVNEPAEAIMTEGMSMFRCGVFAAAVGGFLLLAVRCYRKN